MSFVEQRNPSSSNGERRQPETVAMPRAHEGVQRALLGSFGAIPAMPKEFARLLDRLR
jgi:hypothetical protein